MQLAVINTAADHIQQTSRKIKENAREKPYSCRTHQHAMLKAYWAI